MYWKVESRKSERQRDTFTDNQIDWLTDWKKEWYRERLLDVKVIYNYLKLLPVTKSKQQLLRANFSCSKLVTFTYNLLVTFSQFHSLLFTVIHTQW